MTRLRLTLVSSLACLTVVAIGCDVAEPVVSVGDDGDDGDDQDDDNGPIVAELWEGFELPSEPEEEPTWQECDEPGSWSMCLDDKSVAFCDWAIDGKLYYGECIPEFAVECVPGETKIIDDEWCGEMEVGCFLEHWIPKWEEVSCPGPADTPLVLRFDDAPIEMIAADATPAATFDIAMSADQSSCITTDWPSAATPWLAVDLDRSGTIDGGHELFGSGTQLDGGKADNGFLALAPFDANRDGVVDAKDPRFGELLLWRDVDGDRLSNPGELSTLAESGVDSLSLDYAIERSCDERGNCGIERASFEHAGGRGELVDLHLTCQ